MNYFAIICYSILFVTMPLKGEHPDHPSKETAPVTIQTVGKSVAEFIASDAKLKGGKFLIFDRAANESLQLDLIKIHMDRLTGIGNDTYFACADFQAFNGKVYDLDIFMAGKSADELGVTEIIVHKKEGVQRSGWQEKEGIGVKAID